MDLYMDNFFNININIFNACEELTNLEYFVFDFRAKAHLVNKSYTLSIY